VVVIVVGSGIRQQRRRESRVRYKSWSSTRREPSRAAGRPFTSGNSWSVDGGGKAASVYRSRPRRRVRITPRRVGIVEHRSSFDLRVAVVGRVATRASSADHGRQLCTGLHCQHRVASRSAATISVQAGSARCMVDRCDSSSSWCYLS